MKNFILKILGFKQCEECKKWFLPWKIKNMIIYDYRDGIPIKTNVIILCNQCKMYLIEKNY